MLQGEHKSVAGMTFFLQKIIPFDVWLKTRYGKSVDAFLGLQRSDKEKVFLRWKWGFSENASNVALEDGEQQTLFMAKDWPCDDPNNPYQYYIGLKRQFDRYCFEVKKQIGISDIKSDDPQVMAAIETFGGEEV